jgi:cytidylate kinase
MGQVITIAIDGPAGAGKSSVAKIVADKLGIEYVDSGSIYRAITKKILDSNIKINDYKQIEDLLLKIHIDLKDYRVYIDGVDLTPHIRTRGCNSSCFARFRLHSSTEKSKCLFKYLCR